jgi:hypothetical protein
MEVNLTFVFDNASDAADFLEQNSGVNGPRHTATASGDDWPSAPAEEAAPWDEPVSAPKASADPWAEEATPTTSSVPADAPEPPGRGQKFPTAGSYDKEGAPGSGNRNWNFDVTDKTPRCDCGYHAAKVTGRKAGAKRDWSAYWCPAKFGKNWKDACKFSEFA